MRSRHGLKIRDESRQSVNPAGRFPRTVMARKLFALLITAAFIYITAPLALPVLMGALFAILLMPAQEWLERHRVRSGLAATLMTLGVTLIVILPLSFLLYLATRTGLEQLQALRAQPAGHKDAAQLLLEAPFMRRLLQFATDWAPVTEAQVMDSLRDVAAAISLRTAEFLGAMLGKIPGFALELVIVVVSIFFFLIDGRKLVRFLRMQSFFSPDQTTRLFDTLEKTCRSVVLAALAVGLGQSTVFTVACLIAGVSNALLIGFLCFISSFVPVVGVAPVTLGVALFQLLSGNVAGGVGLLVAAGIAMTLDNIIRPWFLRGAVNLHPLLAFVAAFGGLSTMGFAGIFFGPVIAALFVVTIQILSGPGAPGHATGAGQSRA